MEIQQLTRTTASLVEFVKNLNKKSLMPLIEELENEPSPFSVYNKLTKQDWKDLMQFLFTMNYTNRKL